MFARGLKRKCADGEDGARAAPGGLQRQSLLDMSLVKLQLCHMLAEPNLCRSVLIANTVRQLQEGLARDAAPGAGRGPLQRLVSTDLLCRPPREQRGAAPAPDAGGLLSGLPGAPRAPAPGGAPGRGWGAGGFPAALDQIFETLESRAPRAGDGLFAGADGPYYDLDAVLTGMAGAAAAPGDGFEPLAAAGAPPPGSGCKRDLGELEHVVEILVET